MKKLKKYNSKNKTLIFFSLLFVLLLTSCEDVVTLDLVEPEPRIVIDAEIRWDKETSGNVQVIKISKMAPYYNTNVPKVSGANVKVRNSNGDVFIFTETEAGSYSCNNFVPILNMDYTLDVEAEGKKFSATEKLTSVSPIKKIEQGYKPSSTGPDIPELAFYYDDPADQANYYLTTYKSITNFRYFDINSDELTNGNELNNKISGDELKPGITIEITHRGISKNFYNYMNLIFEASGSNPFATTPGNIRGNIVNTTDPKDFALGYFRLCEANYVTYTMK